MEEKLLDLNELEELENGVGCLLNENNETIAAIECLIIQLVIQELNAEITAKVGEFTTMQDLTKIGDRNIGITRGNSSHKQFNS